ncbi:MAG: hypothetical protein KF847_18505 [Pirellulales bacterium]|nr:hypothetical protein [Pirellulales bacterium]
MAGPTKPDRPAAWLAKQALADVLDVTVNYFDREVRRHAKPEHVRRDGKRLLFYARGVLDAWYGARMRPTQSDAAPGEYPPGVDQDLIDHLDSLLLSAELAELR